MEHNKELKAMSDIIAALSELDGSAKVRVVKSVLELLGITPNATETLMQPTRTLQPDEVIDTSTTPKSTSETIDIRMLKEQRKPKSAIQMAALVAYYLQEIAPIEDRKEVINAHDIVKYFKLAPYNLPTGKNGAADTLNNAKRAGYLETSGTGTYKLNLVGYNLVIRMPDKFSNGHGKKKVKKKKTSKKISGQKRKS